MEKGGCNSSEKKSFLPQLIDQNNQDQTWNASKYQLGRIPRTTYSGLVQTNPLKEKVLSELVVFTFDTETGAKVYKTPLSKEDEAKLKAAFRYEEE